MTGEVSISAMGSYSFKWDILGDERAVFIINRFLELIDFDLIDLFHKNLSTLPPSSGT